MVGELRAAAVEELAASVGEGGGDEHVAWAELHQAELLENWRLARVGATLSETDPLQ